MKTKNTVLASTLAALAMLAFPGCDKPADNTTPTTQTTQTNQSTQSVSAQKYTCEMHPEIVQDQPGECPKCHMKLIAKK